MFAVSGAMGGSASEEFLAPAAVRRGHLRPVHELRLRGEHRGGRDRRAANRSDPAEHPAAAGARHARHPDDRDAGRPAERPRARRREFTAADTLKNVVLRTRDAGRRTSWELLVVGVPGDREVDLKRLGGQLEPVEVEQAGPDDLAEAAASWSRATSARSCSPSSKVRYLVDPLVVEGSAWVTGANEDGKHAANVVRGFGRDQLRFHGGRVGGLPAPFPTLSGLTQQSVERRDRAQVDPFVQQRGPHLGR